MTLHNYRSRQVHETLNGVNPFSSFGDMRSAKSGPNLWQIWQVFGPWASPYGANGHMTMTVHTYRPRQFHRTSNGENPSSGYRDMGSASLAAARPAARPLGPWRQYPSSPEGWGVKISSALLALCVRGLGAVSIRKTVLPGMAIPMLKIRRPNGRLIFNMEIAIVDKTVFILRRGPGHHWIALSMGQQCGKSFHVKTIIMTFKAIWGDLLATLYSHVQSCTLIDVHLSS